MLPLSLSPQVQALREAIWQSRLIEETECLHRLLGNTKLQTDVRKRIDQRARHLVETVRAQRLGKGGLDAFLHEYGLSTREGVLLLCIAEALLRIPDEKTQQKLIREKLSTARWDFHLGNSKSLFVNASTWTLMLSGRVVRMRDESQHSVGAMFRHLAARLGEPIVREAVTQAMRILGRQFILGRTIESALRRSTVLEARGYRFSYDMLGEAARTMRDAERHFERYAGAIAAIGEAADGPSPSGISVKLSALHPRFELSQIGRVMDELVPRVRTLARNAAVANINLTIDAEEAERLEPMLDVIEAVSGDPALAGWDGFGVVVQSYQRTALAVIDWLAEIAIRDHRRLMVRLVKGAYWDAEIKRAQELGLAGYPVFTRKVATDVSFLACARRLFEKQRAFYPQFATHNAHSIAAILELAGASRDFEFQRLHGMGETLYEQLIEKDDIGVGCRIYAPVGEHEDLLPYLVRRLLENGANSSFVNRLQDDRLPIEEIVADPIAAAHGLAAAPHPRIPVPRNIYLPERPNAKGIDLTDPLQIAQFSASMAQADGRTWHAGPIIAGEERADGCFKIVSPADTARTLGTVAVATERDVEDALYVAAEAARHWSETRVEERAHYLKRVADLLEEHMPALMILCIREAGKTINDAIAEVREALDFCRYYAQRARFDLGKPIRLPVPSGGGEAVTLKGGGVFACISPWNFPLAIFTGQVAAALVTGNAAVAKPAEQTPLIAAEAVRLMHRAGVPRDVLHLLPGDGATIGGALVADERVGGVVFTGSAEVALRINRVLAERPGQLPPLIAETGGQNAMIVDSTALPEQVVRDVIVSAFRSAGQRCSALRVLFLQEDVADKMLDMLAGAMEELAVGDPALLSTDIGPVIDEDAQAMLEGHIHRMMREGRLIQRAKLGRDTDRGTFVAPAAFEIDRLSLLQGEVFGPVLHVIRYRADHLPQVVDAINATGFGLTLGIQSRIDETWRLVFERARVGNTYVNRNQIGAVVGVQPFGGQGRSGTGPKAGGPHYLHRFVAHRTFGHEAAADGSPAQDMCPEPRAIRFDRSRWVNAFDAAAHAGPNWSAVPVETRAVILERAAENLEAGGGKFASLAQRGASAGSQTADYLRFYAAQARSTLSAPLPLPGPTGERNELWHRPRGLLLCIFGDPGQAIAQIGAALATGNTVVAASLTGDRDIDIALLFRESGLPPDVLNFLTAGADTSLVDALAEPRLAGVVFSGSPELASGVNRVLAERDGAIIPVIVDSLDRGVIGALGVPPSSSPQYLERFVHERTLTIDTTASGGNASLLSLAGEP